MVIPNMPACPESLKIINHYLNIASEHDGRDAVVSYWCRLYALQQGLKIDKSSADAKKILMFLMDWLEGEKDKAKATNNEAILHEIPAQAYIENYALKLFSKADQQDRAGIFNKNVVKAFYTAGMLYGLLDMFGELTEEVAQNQKYAKWKAAYIHNCLKSGETPVPGPAGGEDDGQDEGNIGFDVPSPKTGDPATPSNTFGASTGSTHDPGFSSANPVFPSVGPAFPSFPASNDTPSKGQQPPPPTPSSPAPSAYNIPPDSVGSIPIVSIEGGIALTPEIIAKAQKLCKYASSALNYDDVKTAINNLTRALSLLTTGKEE